MKAYRTDLVLTGALAGAGVGAGAEAIFGAHSLDTRITWGVISAVTVVGGLVQGLRGIARTKWNDENNERLHTTVAYLQKPEHERDMEMMVTHWTVMQRADALFRANFDYSGPSTDTTSACRLCSWETRGILRDARAESVAHLREAHGLAASA
jgi:hypothetical protein